jgi:hypothetical protein
MADALEENIRLIFGLKLGKLRREQKMSLQELSGKSGLSVSYLNEIEKGKKYPKPDKIHALAEALHVGYEQLVSQKLTKGLSPIAQLLNSDFINEVPFDTFGIERNKLFEMIANAPAKVSAFISTIVEIARNYNLKTEHFYFAALRSYQEMHDNYFEELEDVVAAFNQQFDFDPEPPVTNTRLQSILTQRYHYSIKETDFKEYPHLSSFRAITIPGKDSNLLLLNNTLSDQQRAFYYAREIGFQYMNIKERPYTASWLKVDSFDTLLNNFKASYFAGALIINRNFLKEDIESFFKLKKWDGHQFMALARKYNASPEMFLHRLTNILPRYFGINQLFFIRHSNQSKEPEQKELTKELHLSRSLNKNYQNISEQLYRRYISDRVVRYLERKRRSADHQDMMITAIRSRYFEKGNEYFCITILNPPSALSNNDSSLTIGFVVTDSVKNKIAFLEDPDVYFKRPDEEFIARQSPPEELQRQLAMKAMEEDLEKLFAQNSLD